MKFSEYLKEASKDVKSFVDNHLGKQFKMTNTKTNPTNSGKADTILYFEYKGKSNLQGNVISNQLNKKLHDPFFKDDLGKEFNMKLTGRFGIQDVDGKLIAYVPLDKVS